MKIKNYVLILPILLVFLTSCNNDDDDENIILDKPSISEVEVGLYNNELGVVGEDFHFNAEILAGDLIDLVKININPKSGETYASDWSYEIVWDRYQALKNAKIHQHFDIPTDAPKGNYDFIITVTDQNGTYLEEIRAVELIDSSDFPEVNPHVSVFGIDKINIDGTSGFNSFYNNGEFKNPDAAFFSKDESLWSALQIGGLKGDGIMYGLLIKKSLNHKPETVEAIDFSKVIVTEVVSHSYGDEEVTILKNNRDTGHWNYGLPIKIGAENDNNSPDPNPITGGNAWETGTYYYGVVYTNSSYLKSTFKYIEFDIVME